MSVLWGLLLLGAAWALVSPARGGTVVIDATVDDDLRSIHGTVRFDEVNREVVDPLALLPEPHSDLDLFRTYPGRPNQGEVDLQQQPDGSYAFTTRLPRRFGAVGATRKGLFANGAWYPQPEGLPIVDFEVTVRLPPGTTGALGDVVGTHTLSWTGTAERAPLAVVRGGVLTELDGHGVLLTKGRPPRRVVEQLRKDLARWPHFSKGRPRSEQSIVRAEDVDPEHGIVVRAPLRRRLVRAGPGLAYLSDRAYRLTPGLEFAHRRAITKGVATAWVDSPDPLARELTAAGLGPALDAQLNVDTDRALRRWSWIPQVNSLLASRRIAFYSDILDLPYPGDRVHDDLEEIIAPRWPGAAIAAQIDLLHGEGTSLRVAEHVARGDTLYVAMAREGHSAFELLPYRHAVPVQDLQLTVEGSTVRVERVPVGGPGLIPVGVQGPDDEIMVVTAHSLREALTLELDAPPRRVAIDPDGVIAQTRRVADTHPLRYQVTAAAYIDTLNVTRGQVFGALFTTLRRRGDTRHIWAGSLSNSRSDLVRAGVAHLFKVGPLVDGFNRAQRLRIGGSASVLDPRFADTEGAKVAIDTSLGWSWDTRVSDLFPLSGHRLFGTVTGGAIPGVGETWGGGYAGAIGIIGVHPRLSLAGRAAGSLARANVPHRLLQLGGSGAMRSIPVLPACPSAPSHPDGPCADLATERLLAVGEVRWAPLRNASVPMVLLWGTELQLTAGVEGVVAQVQDEPVRAFGVTTGVLGVGDMLGVEAMAAGVVAGWPVAWEGLELEARALPEIYLRWAQAF